MAAGPGEVRRVEQSVGSDALESPLIITRYFFFVNAIIEYAYAFAGISVSAFEENHRGPHRFIKGEPKPRHVMSERDSPWLPSP